MKFGVFVLYYPEMTLCYFTLEKKKICTYIKAPKSPKLCMFRVTGGSELQLVPGLSRPPLHHYSIETDRADRKTMLLTPLNQSFY